MHVILTSSRALLIVEVGAGLNVFALTLLGFSPLFGFTFVLFFFKLLGVLAVAFALVVVVIVLAL